MKKIILILITLISLQSCSQKKENMINQNINITADNIIEEIAQQVKHYSEEPNYGFRYGNTQCFFELYINDLPAFKQFKKSTSSAFPINTSILKKGIQKVRYKIYPLDNQKFLLDETSLILNLESFNTKNKEQRDIIHLEYNTPQIETKVTPDYSTYKFAGSGKTYYEGSFDINVDVPYELHPPFENAQDLLKMDKKELETKLVKEYNKIRNIYQNKEKNNIAKLVYGNLKTQFITNYSTKEQIKETWHEINEILFNSDIEILPIANYKMQFFANGKLVALFTDGSNPKIRGGNALVCNVKSGNHGKGFIELKHLFYILQGEKEFKVY